MQAQGITAACSLLWERGAAALIGISPFNSYFDEHRIRQLLNFCRQGERPVFLFVPDEVTRYSLEAKGYETRRAVRKMNRQVQYLRNKIVRAANGSVPIVFDCAALAKRREYVQRHVELQSRFESDAPFRRGCLDTTKWVLSASPSEEVGEQAALLGVRYLLAELPMFLHSPEIIGRSEVVFVYHQCPPFVADLYRGRYGGVASSGQGFVEVTD